MPLFPTETLLPKGNILQPNQAQLPWSYCERLITSFAETSASLDVKDFTVLEEGRTKLPRNIGNFHFVGFEFNLHRNNRANIEDEFRRTPFHRTTGAPPIKGRMTPIPENTRFEYRGGYGYGEPYLDGYLALGLAYEGALSAVISGGIDEDGLLITQIQDVSSAKGLGAVLNSDSPVNEQQKEYFKKKHYSNGLRSGIEWKQTLVYAWRESVMRLSSGGYQNLLGSSVRIQAACNNTWVPTYSEESITAWSTSNYRTPNGKYIPEHAIAKYQRLAQTYDGTAKKMGGWQNADKDWVLPSHPSTQRSDLSAIGRVASI